MTLKRQPMVNKISISMTKREITIWCVVLFITLLGCSCANIHSKYSDADMIRMAEEYQELFHKQDISHIGLRLNYYICIYNDDSIYLVSCDGMLIRDVNTREIISTNAKNDIHLSDNMRILLAIVEDIYTHRINYISVKSDTIRMERFDGYYITNIKPYPDSSLKQVQEGWYVHE